MPDGPPATTYKAHRGRGLEPPAFDADALSHDEIAALKQRERLGRDEGASSFFAKIASRGAFRLTAEDATLSRYIAPRPELKVLDAGSGVGRQALVLAARVNRLTCVDFSPRALEVLSGEARRRGITNLETRVADLCELPADLDRFDLVYSSEVFQHIPSHSERRKALGRLHGALVPGGRCVLCVRCWNRRVRGPKDGLRSGIYYHYFTPAELTELFEQAGFKRVKMHGLLILPGAVGSLLPPTCAGIEVWLSRFGMLSGHGRFLIGVGEA